MTIFWRAFNRPSYLSLIHILLRTPAQKREEQEIIGTSMELLRFVGLEMCIRDRYEEGRAMLYNLKDIIRLVDKEDRGIAAFNVFGYEDSQAVIEAAESIGRPVIIMANKDAVNHMGVELIGEIMLHVGAQAKVCLLYTSRCV